MRYKFKERGICLQESNQRIKLYLKLRRESDSRVVSSMVAMLLLAERATNQWGRGWEMDEVVKARWWVGEQASEDWITGFTYYQIRC